MLLNEEDKRELLRVARESIESALNGEASPGMDEAKETFRQPAGAFVTLRARGELRGCIGYIEPKYALVRAVEEVAVKAALDDPRFYPLTKQEVGEVDIEISVLSPLEKIQSISEIQVGKHGLVVDAGFARGLLLPQVAEENRWDRESFLSHTAIKAGLPPEAWKHPAVQVYCFTVDKFSESELAVKHQ